MGGGSGPATRAVEHSWSDQTYLAPVWVEFWHVWNKFYAQDMEAKRQKLENDSTEHEPGKEVIVNVPEGLASCSLGFAIDAGI